VDVVEKSCMYGSYAAKGLGSFLSIGLQAWVAVWVCRRRAEQKWSTVGLGKVVELL